MKKLTFLLGVVCIIGLSSCSKEKDCKCVTSYSGTDSQYVEGITLSMTIKDGQCSELNSTVTVSGLISKTTCTEH